MPQEIAEHIEVQEDPLPEYCKYRDEGCELFPSCLNCPLSRCIYDEPGGVKGVRKRRRDGEILRLFYEGQKTADLAKRFGISRRTVERAVTKGKLQPLPIPQETTKWNRV